MLLYKDLVEHFFAILTLHVHYFLVFRIFDCLLFLLLFLHGLYGRPEILRGCLPVLSSFSLIEPFASSGSHLLFLLQLVLFDYRSLALQRYVLVL